LKNKLSGMKALLIPILCIISFAIIMKIFRSDDKALIVYCSHDSIFADEILKAFTKETGIKVIPRYDTEASKSLGLTEKIILEGNKNDCDVYWSNEVFSMPVLKEANLLDAYKGSGWERIPKTYKDAEGFWTGFAARLRVIIINTEKFDGGKNEIDDIFNSKDLSQTTIALPLYGTTLTHFACLWQSLGKDELIRQYKSWKERGLQIVPGNGPARNLVANGTCKFGWTDTDDYFGAVDKKLPVKMLPVRLPNNSTICIPNTVALLKNSQKKAAAKQLIDFLLSAKTEVALAKSSSRQIPLGEISEELPKDVANLIEFAKQGTDLSNLPTIRKDLIEWLKEEENFK
jgi:iron(III) transport system substrate-binding protein